MFSAILGLVSAGIGAAGAASQYAIAQEQLTLQREALKKQEEMAMLNYGLGLDQLAREREIEAYLRDSNDRNSRLAQEEYAKNWQLGEQRKKQALEERRYVVDRQIAMDKEAAERQAFILEQYLGNKNLAAEERKYAQEQLEIARATARGERDEDLRRYNEERAMAAAERDFAIQEMRRSQGIAAQERSEDSFFRDDIIRRLDDMNATMESTLAGLPPLDAPELLGRDDFEEIYARFDANAVANVDRALDRVASQSEADLMTRGLSTSSIGNSQRSDLARRMALDYQNARDAALRSALDYIGGNNEITLQDFNARKDARGTRLEEIKAMTMPGIEAMLNMRQLRSANDYNLPVQVGSSVFSRNLRSANDFSSPVQMTSGIYDRLDIGYGMADMLATPSAADSFVWNAGSAQYQPQMWGITSPSAFFGNASSGINGLAQGYDYSTWLNSGNDWASMAMKSLGSAAGELQYGGSMSDAGKSQTGAYSTVALPSTTTAIPFSYSPVSLPATAPIPTTNPASSPSYWQSYYGSW